jgi:N-carbamoyl-L-amino-acid hydrolase
MNYPQLNAERLWARVEALSELTRPETPWTRRAFTELFMQSRYWLRDQFEQAGLQVRLDEAGNLIGRRAGKNPQAKALVTGSHCDTVVGGGRFDGIIGVLAGLEIAHSLHEQHIELEHPFEVIDFLSEEPSDYGISCVGSRGIAGKLDGAMLASTNDQGETLAQAIARIGGMPEKLGAPLRPADGSAAFVELHIEQGPVLESRQCPIGVVTNIVGIRRTRLRVLGQPDHAGTTPMDMRRDALVGAAVVIQAVQQAAAELSGKPHYVVATVGKISVSPNVANAVPGAVEMTMEVRSDSSALLDSFPEQVTASVAAKIEALRLTLHCDNVSYTKPTDCSEMVMQTVEEASAGMAFSTLRLPSGAGHDAVYMAQTGPMGMIFVPCKAGRSHCPEEWIEPEQLLDGTRVLYQTILALDRRIECRQ